MQSLRPVTQLVSLRTLYARETRKKKDDAGEFQGATRSSGPESEMLFGSLVFLLSTRR